MPRGRVIVPNEMKIIGNRVRITIINKNKEISYAYVDKDDYDKVKDGRWHISHNGYVLSSSKTIKSDCRKISGVVMLHEHILGVKEHYLVNHKNGDKLDNTKKNLEYASLANKRGNANRLDIILNGHDLYDLKFYSVRFSMKTASNKITVKKEYKDIFFDQLQEIFTQVTGLYTHL